MRPCTMYPEHCPHLMFGVACVAPAPPNGHLKNACGLRGRRWGLAGPRDALGPLAEIDACILPARMSDRLPSTL